MPPTDASNGSTKRRRSRKSPRSNSRRASRPSTKKKNVISPLFTHSRSGLLNRRAGAVVPDQTSAPVVTIRPPRHGSAAIKSLGDQPAAGGGLGDLQPGALARQQASA